LFSESLELLNLVCNRTHLMQRFLDGAAFLSVSLPRLFTFQKTEHSMCVIDGMNFFGMEPRNIAALPRPKKEHTRTAQPICARAEVPRRRYLGRVR
jgi:hypothetical protein